MNEVMNVLTIMSPVFIPLNFIAEAFFALGLSGSLGNVCCAHLGRGVFLNEKARLIGVRR